MKEGISLLSPGHTYSPSLVTAMGEKQPSQAELGPAPEDLGSEVSEWQKHFGVGVQAQPLLHRKKKRKKI